MRVRFPIALVAVVLISGGIGFALSQTGSSPRVAHTRASAVPRVPAVEPLPPGWSYLAAARGRTMTVYRSPGAGGRPPRSRGAIVLTKAVSAGAQLTVLTKRVEPDWIQIYLPIRPNGATGWVRARSVRLLTTPYALSVRLRSHRLVVSLGSRVIRAFKIGVGRAVTPTPTGTYFITELLKQPDPAGPYGPFAYGLSAYSGVLSHFGRGGNGQIGIHGTDEPQFVGTNVSHGCIRLRNPDILWLRQRLPLGTPVSISRA